MSDQGENPHCSTISCMLYTSCILLSHVTRLIRTNPSLVPRSLVNVMRLDEIHTAVSSHIYEWYCTNGAMCTVGACSFILWLLMKAHEAKTDLS